MQNMLKKTMDYHQNDVSFFSSIEKYLHRIRTLAFDTLLKKQILSFSENHSLLYQRIFENEMVISGIKYCSIFLCFALNSVLVFFASQPPSLASFFHVLLISSDRAAYSVRSVQKIRVVFASSF